MLELNEIYYGDCAELLGHIDDDSIPLIATDPPYGLKWMSKTWDKALPDIPIWEECLRVLEPGGFAFIMSSVRQDVLSYTIKNLQEVGFMVNFPSLYWLYFNGKPHGLNISRALHKRGNPEAGNYEGAYSGYNPKPCMEAILIVMKPLSEKGYLNQSLANMRGVTWLDNCRIPAEKMVGWDGKGGFRHTHNVSNYGGYEEGVPRIESGRYPANLLVENIVLGEHSKYFCLGKWFRNIKLLPEDIIESLPFMYVPKPSLMEKGECNNHTTVKPLKLMTYLVTMGSLKGDIVLDPFVGSGTTAVAAKCLGRQYIGIEIDRHSYEIAQCRLQKQSRCENNCHQ